MTMTEENNIETTEGEAAVEVTAAATPEAVGAEAKDSNEATSARRPRGERPEREKREKPKKEFEELLLEVRRVTRVNTG